MPERNKSWAALIYLVHEIHRRALRLQGVRAARLEIVELYGNRINILQFFFNHSRMWITDIWHSGTVHPFCRSPKYSISIVSAFSAFVWQGFWKEMSSCLVVQMNGIKIRSIHVIGAESFSYRRHSLVAFQFANVPHRRKYCWFFPHFISSH